MILALSERSIRATEKAWIKMFEGVENDILTYIQSKTGTSRQRLNTHVVALVMCRKM